MFKTQRPNNRATRLVSSKFKWILRIATDRRVSSLGCRVAVVLLDHIHADWIEAWPSQATLSEYLGVTTRAVRNGLNNLESAGYIETRRSGYRRVNRYKINLPSFKDDIGIELPAYRNSSSRTTERPCRRFLGSNPYNSSPIPTPKALSAEEDAEIRDGFATLTKNLGSRGGKAKGT